MLTPPTSQQVRTAFSSLFFSFGLRLTPGIIRPECGGGTSLRLHPASPILLKFNLHRLGIAHFPDCHDELQMPIFSSSLILSRSLFRVSWALLHEYTF